MLPSLKLYHMTIIVKFLVLAHQKRYTDQLNRIDSLNINLYTYRKVILTSESKTSNGEGKAFKISGIGKIGLKYAEE